MAALENTASLWLDQAVGHHVEGNLTADEAVALTAKIKSYVGVTWILIAEAHERRAHKALGYATWAEYVEAEFDISRSRSYQLISQARVVLEISEAVSTTVDISEREARDLEPVLDEAKRAAVDAVASLPSDASEADRASAASQALDEVRRARQTTSTTTTTRETTTTDFDPGTGEILGGADGRGDGRHDEHMADSGSSPVVDVTPGGEPRPASGPSSEGGSPVPPVGAPGDSPSVPPLDPALGYRATATRFRAQVRQSLLTLDPARVIDTSDEPDHWAEFSQDVHDWLRRLDDAIRSGRHLRAVK